MAKCQSISVAMSSDLAGFRYNATVIASILRRTSLPVHVKFYCVDFIKESFSLPKLNVEFITGQGRLGQYPAHVTPAAFARLQVIRDAIDWDRCLILDHDMIALCDVAEYFNEDFEGNLLMARIFETGDTLGQHLPQDSHAQLTLKSFMDLPYFYMGPMMNLKDMREDGTWEKLLAAHEIAARDEQVALTIATGGRIKGVGSKWNLVPHRDYLCDGQLGLSQSRQGIVGESPQWGNDLPEGILHWTGWEKPWHYGNAWRPDLWAAEATSWEELRNGWWEKPRAAVVESNERIISVNLAARGWKVDFFPLPTENTNQQSYRAEPIGTVDWTLGEADSSEDRSKKEIESHEALSFPDLIVHEPSKLRENAFVLQDAEFLWFESAQVAVQFLNGSDNLPLIICLTGPLSAHQLQCFRNMGYILESIVNRHDWPKGVPAPTELDYMIGTSKKVDKDENVYLQLSVTKTLP